MRKIAYTVSAAHPDPASATRYVAWLKGGHTAAVVAGGATSAMIITLDPVDPSVPARTVEVRYIFPSRAALDRYVAEHAPRLRAEGLALFGPGSGVAFTRSVGEVVGE